MEHTILIRVKRGTDSQYAVNIAKLNVIKLNIQNSKCRSSTVCRGPCNGFYLLSDFISLEMANVGKCTRGRYLQIFVYLVLCINLHNQMVMCWSLNTVLSIISAVVDHHVTVRWMAWLAYRLAFKKAI